MCLHLGWIKYHHLQGRTCFLSQSTTTSPYGYAQKPNFTGHIATTALSCCHAFHCALLAELNLYRPALMVHLGFKPNRAHVTPLDLAPLVTCRSKHQIQGSVRSLRTTRPASFLLLQSFQKSICTILCSQ